MQGAAVPSALRPVVSQTEGRKSIICRVTNRRAALLRASGSVAAVLLTSLVFSPSAFGQRTINVMQIEDGRGLTPAYNYSPVEFVNNGIYTNSFTATNSLENGNYTGITFTNNVNIGTSPFSGVTTTTYSSDHGNIVGAFFYGNGKVSYGSVVPGVSPAYNFINTVYTDASRLYSSSGGVFSYTTPFLTNTLRVSNATTGPIPNPIGNNIRVINNSWVATESAIASVEASRRVDFLTNRDNVVWVGGVANGTNFGGTTAMGWRPRNGIAVSSSTPSTPYDPTLAHAAAFNGRDHADIWSDQLSSYGAGQVSAASVVIINQLQNRGVLNPANYLVKSLLMTSANKLTTGTTFTGWVTDPIGNNLNQRMGAGQLDLNAATNLASATTITTPNLVNNASTNGTVVPSGTPSTSAQSFWSTFNVPANGTNAAVFTATGGIRSLTSTLNWNWTSTTNSGAGTIDTSDGALIAPDLSYRLYTVSWTGSNYTIGAIAYTGTSSALSSDAFNNDNVEFLTFNPTNSASGGNLNPGTYALVVQNKSSRAVDAALSLTSIANSVPTWTRTTSGNWRGAEPGNWSTNLTPNGFSQVVVFGNAITSNAQVTVSQNTTVGSLSFSGNFAYTIAASSGSLRLLFDNAALGDSVITVAPGAIHQITAQVSTVNSSRLTVSFTGSGAGLGITTLTNTAAFGLTGPGTLTIGTLFSSAANVAVASTSTLAFNGSATSTLVNLTNSGAVNLSTGTLTATGTITGATGSTFTISAGGLLNHNGAVTSTLPSLTLSNGQLAVNNGTLNVGALTATTADTINVGVGDTLGITGSGSSTAGAITNAGTLSTSGTTNLTLSGGLSSTGNVTIGSGTSLNLNSSSPSSIAALTSSGSLGVANGTVTATGAITGNSGSSITVSNNGQLRLTGAVTSTTPLLNLNTGGSLVVNAGTLSVTTSLSGSSATATVASGASLNLSNTGTSTLSSLANSGNVTVTGGGTLTISSTVTGATGNLTVGGGSQVTLSAPGTTGTSNNLLTQNSISLSGTGTNSVTRAILSVSGNTTLPRGSLKPNVLVVNSISIASSGPTYFGFLNLGSSDVIVKGGAASLASLRAMVGAWYSSALSGTTPVGIGSSLAGNASNPYTIAVFQNSFDGQPYYTSYDGISGLTTGDVILKFAYKGDVNLDGVVDGADTKIIQETIFLGSLAGPLGYTGWNYGDVNYDNVIDNADLNLASAFAGLSSLGNGTSEPGSTSAIPEPSALALAVPAALLGTRRRRSR